MTDPFDLPPDVLRGVPLFAELQKVLSWSGGPVNRDLARQVASSMAASASPPGPGPTADEMNGAVQLAELWLADACAAPSPSRLATVVATDAAGWASRAPEAFAEIVEPVAAKAGGAAAHADLAAAGPLAAAIGQITPMLMGMQTGAIMGRLATLVLGDHEVGFPAGDDTIAFVAPAIDRTADGYGLDRLSVRQVVALHAAASRMVWDGFDWTRARFYALFHDYVASLDVDVAAAIERLRSLDLGDPSRLQEALADGGLFAMEPSPATEAAAARVSSLLAMAQAHASAAAADAAQRAGDVAPVVEALARRQANDAPLHAFAGIEVPERRASVTFVRAAVEHGGWELANKIWDDPASFPTEAEVAEPRRWIERRT